MNDAGRQALDDVLEHGSVRTVFQPIVDLASGAVVAYEALSRGPAGPLEAPDRLFDAARSAGRLAELDELCRRTALASAIEAGMFAPTTVFVNVEPEVLESARLEELVHLAAEAPGDIRVVLEITERAMSARPAELLATAQRLRAAGWRLALDDVGADDMSLAFMPLLRPDIVKLDLRLVQRRPGPAVAEIMNAVNAYAERTGAVLLAEGIEDEEHLNIARALGARLGQGWLFGRPQAIDVAPATSAAVPLPSVQPNHATPASPFACLPSHVPLRRSTKPLLIELSKFLEREAMRLGSTCMVVAAFQHARHFTPTTADRYRELVHRVGFVAAIGEDLGPEPVFGLRGADLAPDDEVRREWDIVVLAPHFAAALLARDLGDDGPDRERRFEFALTYDRDLVSAAAQSLMSRVLPKGGSVVGRSPGSGHLDAVADLRREISQMPAAASGETLRRALSATSNGVTIADVTRPDHPLVYVNAAFERLTGLRAEDVLGRNCRLLQGPDTDRAAVRRIREALVDGREIRETLLNHRGPDQQPWWNEIYLAPVLDDNGRLTQYIGIQNDVTDRVEAELRLQEERRRSAAYLQQLETLAFRDPLTALLNRRRVFEELETTLATAGLHGEAVALLYLDVDDFKSTNDRHGHAAGDAVLLGVADRLRAAARPADLVARLGGDEFLVVMPGLVPGSARFVAERLAGEVLAALGGPIPLPAGAQPVRASVGISIFPADGSGPDELVHAADQRMYAVKHVGRQAVAG